MSTPAYVAAWLSEVSKHTARHRLILTTLGHAHDPVRTAIGSLSDHILTVSEYLSQDPLRSTPALVVLSDLECLCGDTAETGRLGKLRERVSSDLDDNINFVMVSRFPRIRYPKVPGSSLLEDAKILFPPLASPAADNTHDPASVLPVYAANESVRLESILRTVLEELGDEVLSSLDHTLFEAMCGRDEVLSIMEARVIEALQGAGLVTLSGQDYVWTMPTRFGELKDSLADALARMTHTHASLTETFGALWSLERSLRRAMRTKALSVWGQSWRQQSLNGDLPARVLERAKGDAYVAAKSIREIRDPFEWLTMGELLDLRKRPEFGDLGLEDVVWNRLATEVLPVRNRLSHMRLLQDGDLSRVRTWQRVLARKLQG